MSDSKRTSGAIVRGWTGQKAWKDWSGRLAVAEEDDFERAVLPLLRLFWPGMQQAPRKKGWDARGIDLFVWADTGPFPCAVQCKGFKVQKPGHDQIRQIEKSIQKFIDSDCSATTYLLVHNRDGQNRELVRRAEELLTEAVRQGRAQKALLWDRQRVVKEAFDRMALLLRDAVRRNSASLAERSHHLFRFGDVHVDQVPVTERILRFKRDAACEISEIGELSTRSPREALEKASGTRWTILTGHFGLGKTTAALAAATASAMPMVFVPCAAVPAKVFKTGNTNSLTQHVVESLSLLDDVEDSDRDLLIGTAGSVLSYLLREPQSPFAFILDGLDEHHVFARLNGLQRLSNQLAEFSCPVVLTTRREHLETMLGDFNVAFGELGTKFASVREAKALYLERWTLAQTSVLVEGAVAASEGVERKRLLDLRDAVTRPETGQLYGDLIFHPLFLQFILEDVAENGLSRANRTALICRWVERKIRRDRQTWLTTTSEPRVQIDPLMDTDEYVERIFTAMKQVAFEMSIEVGDGSRELLEGLPSEQVTAIVAASMNRPQIDLLLLLLNSVLVTLGPRRGATVPVGFALRVLHEYFVASYLAESELDTAGWPASVRELVDEMLSSRSPRP